MTRLWKSLRPALVCLAAMSVLCGVIYAGTITGMAQLLFPDKANGSIIHVALADGREASVGSEWIAQTFTDARYLVGRPSGPTNLSATSSEEAARVHQRLAWLQALDPGNSAPVPLDLVTASGSGADPYISPTAAAYQAARIARTRGISQDDVMGIIERNTVRAFLGIWGEKGVHVLKVNLELDGLH